MLGTGAVLLYLGRPISSCLHIVPRQSEFIVTDMWCLEVAAKTYLTVCALGPRRHIDTAMMCVAWQLACFHLAGTAWVECKQLFVWFHSAKCHVRKCRYSNHTAVGRAIHKVLKEAKINREDLWVTSKVCFSLSSGCAVHFCRCEKVRVCLCILAEPMLLVELL